VIRNEGIGRSPGEIQQDEEGKRTMFIVIIIFSIHSFSFLFSPF
jgi:hypothetical protein